MTTIKITPDFVKKYTKGKYKNENYAKTVELMNSMRIHADGLFPDKLIGERRPSESKTIFDYRQKIYEPQTVEPFSKISNSLAKIRRSQDWSIKYSKDVSGKIKEEETLERYCEYNYPEYSSITNWFFTVGLKAYLVDPNGVILVYPKEIPIQDNEYVQPEACIYNSGHVMDWKENDYAVLLQEEKNYFIENGQTHEGDIYLIITDSEIWTAKQINLKGDYQTELFIRHDLGFLPCRKIRGLFYKNKKGYHIYKSRLSPCLPAWNEAVREYSDMQASVVKHMFPTLVIHTNAKCNSCNGTGKILQPEGKGIIQCETCKGNGSVPTSPYEDIVVRPQQANEQPLPSPIAYYVDKDSEIIKIQDERIDKHIFKGYSAVNFDFLYVGLNQSGIAKEYDRSELNAFIYDIAEDIIAIFDDVYYYINEWRYKDILSEDERDKQLPKINVPEKYDIVSENYLIEEINKAKTSKVNPFIITNLEIELAAKKFNTNPEVRDLVQMSMELDPLAGFTEDEKMVKLSNNAILKQDYIISSYITSFIRRAIDENKYFISKTYAEKIDVLRSYADEIISKNSSKEEIINSGQSSEGNDKQNNGNA